MNQRNENKEKNIYAQEEKLLDKRTYMENKNEMMKM